MEAITRRARGHRLRRSAAVLATGVWLAAAAVLATPAAGAAEAKPHVLFSYADPEIVESSGLAASRLHKGIVYTHNDTEPGARVFAVGRDGKTKATFTLRGVKPRDWEGIALGKTPDGKPAIFVGDIGDNFGGAWPEIWVYRFREPKTVKSQTVKATKFRFRYADGPRNAEALLVDPRENRIYIVSKEPDQAGVYLAPPTNDLSTTKVNVLHRIAPAPDLITDGAFAPNGRRVVLRDYVYAHIYAGVDGDQITRMTLPLQKQGEAVTFTPDGSSLLVGTEGAHSEVWQVPLPASALPSSSGTAAADGSEDTSAWQVGGNLIALVVSGAAFFGLFQVLRTNRKKP